MENEKIKGLIRIGKMILLILSAIVALAVLIAYKMSIFFGVPGFKD
jgi:hypothetical protein